MKIGDYETHPIADVFDLLEGSAIAGLAADIAENGLINPIWLHKDGRILDGRNRLNACLFAMTEPRFQTYEGDTPAAFVTSLNAHRRHDTYERRLAAAAALKPHYAKEAKVRQYAGKALGSTDQVQDPGPGRDEGQARDIAAKHWNVSGRQIDRLENVKAESPELFEAVKGGHVKVRQADNALKLPPDQRAEVERVARDEPERTAAAIREALREGPPKPRRRPASADGLVEKLDGYLVDMWERWPDGASTVGAVSVLETWAKKMRGGK